MIKRNKWTLLVTSVVLLIPVFVGLLLWNTLPEKVPMHWNAAGEVDGWGSRATVVFFLPLLVLAFHWFGVLVTAVDPKSWDVHGKVLNLMLWICPILSLLCSTFVYATALGYDISIEIIMPLLFGALFMVIGNLMPKCKQNYSIGIKVPWALHDEENWNRTHRFAGKVWVIGGALIMATSVLGNYIVFFSIVLIMAFAPMVYSYLYYRKTRKEA